MIYVWRLLYLLPVIVAAGVLARQRIRIQRTYFTTSPKPPMGRLEWLALSVVVIWIGVTLASARWHIWPGLPL